VRRRVGAVVGTALTEEAQLLVGRRPRRAVGEARGELRIALGRVRRARRARRGAAPRVLVEALTDARGVEVGEGTDRVQPESLTGRRQVLSTERRERLASAETTASPPARRDALARGDLGAEQPVGDAERRVVTRDLAHRRRERRLQHRGLAAEEPARSAHRQDEETEAHRLGEGTEHAQRVEQRRGSRAASSRRAPPRQGLDPYREEALH
jgi:hypothetical protein